MRRRVALIGVGRFGRRLLPLLSARFEVAVCCSLGSPTTADWLRRRHPDVRYTTSLPQALAAEAIDGVVIATPIETHGALAAAALAARKHVFVEKPLATSSSEADSLVRRAGEHELVLFVGHQYLYHPVFRRLRDEVGEGSDFVRLSWRKFGTFDSDLFWNLASHEVSLVLSLMGDPIEIEVLLARGVITECDMTLIRLGFSAGRQAVIDIDRSSPQRDKTVTVVRGDSVFVWRGDSLFAVRGDAELSETVSVESDAIALELDDFASAIERDAPSRSNGGHAAHVVRVVEQIRARVGEAR